MKSITKRLWALFMVLALSATFYGCNVKPVGQNGDEAPDDAMLTITIGLPSNAKVTDYENNAFTAWLEDMCNVQLVFRGYVTLGHHVATPTYDEVDILWGISLDASLAAKYGQEGYILELGDYYADKEDASRIFWERLEDLTPTERDQVLNRITDPVTGQIYAVPTVQTYLTDGIYGTAWINQKWLDKLDLSAPTTADELYDVLVAFKENDCNGNGDPTDEIPLFGTENSTNEASVISWLMNLYLYYNPSFLWQDYDGNGSLEAAYTQDAYREALRFINKLYAERLLTTQLFTASSGDTKSITTPNSDLALCGIFLGDLTGNTTYGSQVLYEYVPLPTFGCAVREEVPCTLNAFITGAAAQRGVADRCFALLMTMWSREGSMRMRYGEYRVDWTDPSTDGASAYGITPAFNLLDDPFMKQSAANWGAVRGTFLQYAGGENAQTPADAPQWEITAAQMQGKAWEYYRQAEQNVNPKYLEDPFQETFLLTDAEQKQLGYNNLSNVFSTYLKLFVTGEKKMDIDNDDHWQAYLDELKQEHYDEVQAAYQVCYERQK